ncbi:hypothetical protein [Lysinibacillus sp. G4S2]|uniref:hypothetical protein n=1 Tax=Lysinibacillus sp. G4S2 TaxID=3055859 RepID=UPI0025A10DF9|nr:hypothetical protein [Lysinibacillus sp. G4S2]MDM5246481.1 hypothetical protein [Lysinibacillus sp. G4S2]
MKKEYIKLTPIRSSDEITQCRNSFHIHFFLSVAKAKRQQQMFSVRKRSDSNNCAEAQLIVN